ncbi:DNA alkylation repair protein [Algoriphagus sediminis]|uniref:DNA alkylation repair protein n=1 Tax=Algoriphagus sediminis TaxID=3057113 RepID=A0ABT7YFA4_9BACT|nr:DNA alkylation repair protein [Algoriphagus sediminis]MDN3205208.1 DNA alkylation repair protein [Algoriphagus sediminis]
MSELTDQMIAKLQDRAIPEKAAFFPKFFKTGPGEYGEGDKFLGVMVPEQRKVAKMVAKEISFDEVDLLLKNPYHEVRLCALFTLVYKYQKLKSESDQKELVDFYLDHVDYINNWDLVDTTCHPILGHYFQNREKNLFYGFARSGNLWEQRIAMITSLYWIKRGEFDDALALAEILRNHPHDLMHKAVGWMLREIGKMDMEVEMEFLKKHYSEMPRTMLRYAIEKFPEDLRQGFLKGEI